MEGKGAERGATPLRYKGAGEKGACAEAGGGMGAG